MSTPGGGDRRGSEPPEQCGEEGRSHSQAHLRGFSVNMLEPPAHTHHHTPRVLSGSTAHIRLFLSGWKGWLLWFIP